MLERSYSTLYLGMGIIIEPLGKTELQSGEAPGLRSRNSARAGKADSLALAPAVSRSLRSVTPKDVLSTFGTSQPSEVHPSLL